MMLRSPHTANVRAFNQARPIYIRVRTYIKQTPAPRTASDSERPTSSHRPYRRTPVSSVLSDPDRNVDVSSTLPLMTGKD